MILQERCNQKAFNHGYTLMDTDKGLPMKSIS